MEQINPESEPLAPALEPGEPPRVRAPRNTVPPRRGGKAGASEAGSEQQRAMAAQCRATMGHARSHEDATDRWIYDRCGAVVTMEAQDLWGVDDARSREEQLREYKIVLGGRAQYVDRTLNNYKSILQGVQREDLVGTRAGLTGLTGISRLRLPKSPELQQMALAYARGPVVRCSALHDACIQARRKHDKEGPAAAIAFLRAELARLSGLPEPALGPDEPRPEPTEEEGLTERDVERAFKRIDKKVQEIKSRLEASPLQLGARARARLEATKARIDEILLLTSAEPPPAAPPPEPPQPPPETVAAAPVTPGPAEAEPAEATAEDEQEADRRWLLGVSAAVRAHLAPQDHVELERRLVRTLAGHPVRELVALARTACTRLAATYGPSPQVAEVNEWIEVISNPRYEYGWNTVFYFFVYAQLPGFLDHLHYLQGVALSAEQRELVEWACSVHPRPAAPGAIPAAAALRQEMAAFFGQHSDKDASLKGMKLFWEGARPLTDDLDALERRIVAELKRRGEDSG